MSAGPYRTPAPTPSSPSSPKRPALAWWQALIVALFGDEWCCAFRWYRAHVGGWWSCATSLDGPRGWVLASKWPEMHAEVNGHDVEHDGCEVYPWSTVDAGPCPLIRLPRDGDATARPELPPGREVYWEPSGWIEPSLGEIRRIEAHNAAVRAMPAAGTAEDYDRWAREFGIVDQARWLAARGER